MSDQEYHTQRASAEFDMAQRAERAEAAAAHLRLSSLHMERARAADRVPAARQPATV